jgi:hypothetical protein
VVAGLCKYESLYDGTLELNDFFIMNEMLAVKYENKRLANEAAERK